MGNDKVDWVSNAGKSISHIVQHLQALQLEGKQQQYINQVLGYTKDPLNESKSLACQIASTPKNNDMGESIFNFYGNTSIYINGQPGQPVSATAVIVPAQGENLIAMEKKERFDGNYDDRTGYDQGFLKDFHVPFPSVKSHRAGDNFWFETLSPQIANAIKNGRYKDSFGFKWSGWPGK